MARRGGTTKRGARSPERTGAPARPGLSIVVPLHNEAVGLPGLHQRLLTAADGLKNARGLPVEIVYVDDGSSDRTLEIARTLPAKGVDLQVVALSRNFGKEAALLAGLDHAGGEALLFMDGDGQHPPELIEKLVALWHADGNDVVYTVKAHRANESLLRRLAVKSFYRLLNLGARQPIPEDASDFRLLSPRAAAALKRMPERNRFFKGLSSWIGFRQVQVPYEPPLRAHGRSSWNLRALVGLSIEGLTAFSTTPLRIASVLGLLLAASALLFGVWILADTVIRGRDVPGYPSVIVGIMVIGGAQLVMIGIVGEYVAKILSELKARPVYFVAEHVRREAEE
jgi:glycosyltransferase involved in cell wall biosynthesis